MTLPFLSDGGTSLIVSSFAVGLALGAARKTHEELYPCTPSNATASSLCSSCRHVVRVLMWDGDKARSAEEAPAGDRRDAASSRRPRGRPRPATPGWDAATRGRSRARTLLPRAGAAAGGAHVAPEAERSSRRRSRARRDGRAAREPRDEPCAQGTSRPRQRLRAGGRARPRSPARKRHRRGRTHYVVGAGRHAQRDRARSSGSSKRWQEILAATRPRSAQAARRARSCAVPARRASRRRARRRRKAELERQERRADSPQAPPSRRPPPLEGRPGREPVEDRASDARRRQALEGDRGAQPGLDPDRCASRARRSKLPATARKAAAPKKNAEAARRGRAPRALAWLPARARRQGQVRRRTKLLLLRRLRVSCSCSTRRHARRLAAGWRGDGRRRRERLGGRAGAAGSSSPSTITGG
jgi:hypothetical protein